MNNGGSKLIIISEEDTRMMSFEEVCAMYRPWLKWRAGAWMNTHEFDDLYQEALVSFWKAYRKYDAVIYPIPFLALASKYVKYGLLAYHNQQKPKTENKTSQVKSVTSLQSSVLTSKGEELDLEDIIGEPETYSEEIVDQIVLDRVLNLFPPMQKQDILMCMDGYNVKDLLESEDRKERAIGARMRGAAFKFRSEYAREMTV